MIGDLAGWIGLAGRTVGWSFFVLVLRLAPLAIVLPVFGGLKASPTVRTGAVLALALGCWPAAAVLAPASTLDAIRIGASQLGFGFATAACCLFVVEAARMVGGLADTALGRGSFGAADPLGQGASGPLATLHALLFVAVFAASGSHLLVIGAFDAGLGSFPLDAVLGEADIAALADEAIRFSGAAIGAALALALPALGVGLVVDVSLGWMSRTLPQLPVLFVAMPLRMVLGWIVVAALLAVGMEWLVGASVDAFVSAVEAPR